jgi:hypothetical protein
LPNGFGRNDVFPALLFGRISSWPLERQLGYRDDL